MILEPLENKKKNISKIGFVYNEDSIISAVQFFKTYRSNIKKLLADHENIWKKWIDYYNNLNESNNPSFINNTEVNKLLYIDKFNKWLFDYSFSDVIEL
jgi:hypothetical protein